MQDSVYVGLGSNVGDRVAHLLAGLAGLQRHGISVTTLSSFYLTEPDLRAAVDEDDRIATPGDPPPPDHPWYVNCVAALADTPEPHELLALCLEIEHSKGRRRGDRPDGNGSSGPAPRTLDIDLLLYGDRIIDEPGLQVPHPRLHHRRFVLAPLAEIAPDLRHPVLDATIRELLDALPQRESVSPLQPQPGGAR